MKKLFLFCLTAALAAGFTACSDDKDDQPSANQITIDGTTHEIKSAFYDYWTDEDFHPEYNMIFFSEKFESVPQEEPEFYATLDFTEDLIGKTIDLTKVLPKTGTLEPYVYLGTNAYNIEWYSDSVNSSITSGTLRVTANNGYFTVELSNFSADLSNGEKLNVSCTWSGTAKQEAWRN